MCFHDVSPGATVRGTIGYTVGLGQKMKIKKTARGIAPLAVVHSEFKIYRFFPTATPNRKIAKNTAKIGWIV